MPSTQGYGVQVMPGIQFSDGAQLAGHAPGEVIAGFNSGIGAFNAIQNTRQKAILAPIEQDQARARLAQIQAETESSLAQAPYRNALARIEATKASLPVRFKQGESIVGVPEIGANGQPTGRIHQVIQDTGIEFDPTTQTRTPYTAMSKPLVTADQGSLNNSLIDSRQAAADARAALLGIQQQNADTSRASQLETVNRNQNYFNLGQQKVDVSKERAAQESYFPVQGVDANGNLTLIPFGKKSGAAGTNISTGVKPKGPDDFFAPKPGATTTTTKKVVPQSSLVKMWNRLTGPSAPVDQTATGLPNIPLSTIPSGQMSANPAPPNPYDAAVDDMFDSIGGTQAPVAAPSNSVQSGRYTVKPK